MLVAINDVCWSCPRTRQCVSVKVQRCVLECSVVVLGTILFLQSAGDPWPIVAMMTLVIMIGLLSAVILMVFALPRQMDWRHAFKLACVMSMLAMLAMEIAMNTMDVITASGTKLYGCLVPVILLAGFLAFLPYNLWRLESMGKACHSRNL